MLKIQIKIKNIKSLFITLLLGLSYSQTNLQAITLNNNNHVSLLGVVDEVTIDRTIQAMNKITKPDYYFYINSPGGFVEEGERLVSHMNYHQGTGKNITCIAENAHSMAFYIFQNCNRRLIIPSTKVMQHQITIQNSGQLANIHSYIEMIQRISHRMNIFCSERIGIPLEEFNKRVMSDWWLYGEDIITNGVADEMVLVGCNTTKDAYLDNDGLLHINNHPCPLVNNIISSSPSPSQLSFLSSKLTGDTIWIV